jgi:hypothetical protein
VHKGLEHVSPLAVSVMLEIGRETVYGEAAEDIMAQAEAGASRGGDGVNARAAISGGDEIMPVTGIVGVGGFAFIADPSGALYLAEDGVLLVADLHLEKGSAFAARGMMLPPYDSRATLAALAIVLARYRPRTVIVLGDSLHDRKLRGPAGPRTTPSASRALADRPQPDLGGGQPRHRRAARTCRAKPWPTNCRWPGLIFRHEPQAGLQPGEVAGHLHPCAPRWPRPARQRCAGAAFVSDQERDRSCQPSGPTPAASMCATRPYGGLFARPPLAGALGRIACMRSAGSPWPID